MEYNMPRHIVSEKDLKAYEDFLNTDNKAQPKDSSLAVRKNERSPQSGLQIQTKGSVPMGRTSSNITPDVVANPIFFQGYLKNHIGKLIKVESLVGDCLESRIGTLLEVGFDYIVIKLHRSCCSMMIHSATVKYITIVHDNDINKMLRS